MSEKQKFFESLEPKSALLVGLIGGILLLGTIGFVIMLSLNLRARSVLSINNNRVDSITKVGDDVVAPLQITAKNDRPKVELFVMSYCPFGLQMEKAYLPAWTLLKNKADISIKFVNYIMHGKKEIDENSRQYCIGQKSPEKLIAYLNCFVAEDNAAKCLVAAGLTENQLSACVRDTDSKFQITAKYNDQSSWLSGRYPLYNVHADLNSQYGVQGSPTLVINGQEVSVARTPEAVKQAICGAFNTPPAECEKTLSNTAYSAGFGLTASDNAANVECGA